MKFTITKILVNKRPEKTSTHKALLKSVSIGKTIDRIIRWSGHLKPKSEDEPEALSGLQNDLSTERKDAH
eukprot:5400024-Amphidinium_carterae.1